MSFSSLSKNSIKILILFLIVLVSNVKANTYLNENITWSNELTASFWTSIALGDIDNDNDLDLVQIGCTGTTGGLTCNGYISKIYTNNGVNLTENTTWQQNLTAVHYGSFAWGDVDLDGDLDLALTGCNNGGGAAADCGSGGTNSFIYINNGTSLVENSTWKGDIIDVWKSSIALGDIDLDGDLDLALTGASSTAYNSKIYVNNGTGFAENTAWQSDLTAVYDSAIALGDINNDGKLDLILTGSDGTSEVAKAYINNGSSLIENTTWQQNLLAVDSSAISLGDFDNNGRLDLTLIGHYTHDNHEIYNNTGTTFEMMQTEAAGTGDLVGIFEGSQHFGGYDNDGDLDLITAGEEQYTTVYLYNASSFLFTTYRQDPEPNIFNTAFGPSAVWGDLDNDGDLDLTLIGVDSSDITRRAAVYINNITTANTVPNPPTILNATYKNGQLTITWNNGSDTETVANGLYYNLKVSTTSGGHSIVSGIYGGGDDNGYFGNMMQRKSVTLNVDLSADDTIYYSVQTIDTALANGSWSVEQSYTIPQDTNSPTITINSPVNGFNTSNSTVIFNATVVDNNNLTNVTLYGNWTGSLIANESNTTGVNNTYYVFSKNLSIFGDGVYSWYFEARDTNDNNTAVSSTRTFRIDTTYPQVNISSPLNGSTQTSSSTVIFTYNVTDADISNCILIIDGNAAKTDTTVTVNTAQTFSESLDNGDHTWSVNCTDYTGLENNSATHQVTVAYSPPSGGYSSSSSSSSGQTKSVKAKAGETKSVSFSNLDVTEISITPSKETSVSVTVEPTSLLDYSVRSAGPPGGKVYNYLRITSSNDIEKAVIKFKVPFSWLKDYDKVVLKRRTTVWESLPTKEISKDLTNVFYEAETSGFSLFAITTEKKVEEVVEEVKEENVTVEVEEEIDEVEETISKKKDNFYLYLIAVLIAGFGYLAYYKWKKRK